MVKRVIRALTGVGWVLVLPVPPFEPGRAVPVPRRRRREPGTDRDEVEHRQGDVSGSEQGYRG
jgi:hypothetical protein